MTLLLLSYSLIPSTSSEEKIFHYYEMFLSARGFFKVNKTTIMLKKNEGDPYPSI